MATRSSGTDGGTGLPTGVVEDLLSAETRRLALAILYERGEPMVVESLAAAVAAARADHPASAVPSAEQEAVREELYTEHIPKLTATGVVEYDSMVGTVELLQADIGETAAAAFR